MHAHLRAGAHLVAHCQGLRRCSDRPSEPRMLHLLIENETQAHDFHFPRACLPPPPYPAACASNPMRGIFDVCGPKASHMTAVKTPKSKLDLGHEHRLAEVANQSHARTTRRNHRELQ